MDPIRVLCVDDDRDVADSTAELLRLAGYNARACYDGASALSEAERFRPDVGLLDLGMPGLDGEHLAVWLRARAAGRPLGLVAVTGWTGDEVTHRAKAAGFDVVVTKPAEPQRLAATVAEVHRWLHSAGASGE